ncbi:ethanolamine utilization protein EutH, partial [Clostridioides difficile]|uniref:ethanolamine utilization protein EutH n=1 Tax=Clostridioides difficile TaxID=1496 RepID=UPI003F8D5CFE
PFGGIIGGLIAGFNLSMVIINMIPVIILAVILAVGLKFNSTLNVCAENPKMADRDRFVLSKGHAAPALYATLAEKGFFPEEEL